MEGDRRRSGGGGASARADLYEHDPAMGPARAQDSWSNIIIPMSRAFANQQEKCMHSIPKRRAQRNGIKLNTPVLYSLHTSGDGAWLTTLDMQHEK